MSWCNHCGKTVPAMRPYDAALACNLCGRILEDFKFSTEVTFVKNAAGQSQACGNIVRSVQSGISTSRERRIRIAKEAALKAASEALKASNSNCPEHARKLYEATKDMKKSRREKQQKRAEEAKNASPLATAMEAVHRTLAKKRISGLIKYDVLEELFDPEKSPKRSNTETDMEKNKEEKSNEHENGENENEYEEDEEGSVES